MKIFLSKKAFVTDWGDLFKGFFFGFISGAIIITLGCKGVISIPMLP